jgi:hypothetical protein
VRWSASSRGRSASTWAWWSQTPLGGGSI